MLACMILVAPAALVVHDKGIMSPYNGAFIPF